VQVDQPDSKPSGISFFADPPTEFQHDLTVLWCHHSVHSVNSIVRTSRCSGALRGQEEVSLLAPATGWYGGCRNAKALRGRCVQQSNRRPTRHTQAGVGTA